MLKHKVTALLVFLVTMSLTFCIRIASQELSVTGNDGVIKKPQKLNPQLTGIDRLNQLLCLTQQYNKKDSEKAYLYGSEAMKLIERIPVPRLRYDHLIQMYYIAYHYGKYNEAIK